MSERIAVIGLGYVGLPVALAFARKFPGTVGFDIHREKVDELRRGYDRNHEQPEDVLQCDAAEDDERPRRPEGCTFFVVAVPTPVDDNNVPDLTPVERASETVGKALGKGAVVVYESTVYPGVTEDVCGPILERVSGLKRGRRLQARLLARAHQPGRQGAHARAHHEGRERRGRRDARARRRGLRRHRRRGRAPGAEHQGRRGREGHREHAARSEHRADERAGDHLRPHGHPHDDVLAAAGTKWNFLKFQPGLVGGHCIGVDPYYLTMKAQQLGYQPEVILAGRRINNNMGPLRRPEGREAPHRRRTSRSRAPASASSGLTFKEDCNDIRNSKVPDILRELRQFGIEPMVHDPLASAAEAMHEYGVKLAPHRGDVASRRHGAGGQPQVVPRPGPAAGSSAMIRDGGVLVDVKSVLDPGARGTRHPLLEPVSQPAVEGWTRPRRAIRSAARASRGAS